MNINTLILNYARKLLYQGLYEQLQPYRVLIDADMPIPYRNGTGRENHTDWLICKSTPRINTAYKVPMPFRKIAGTQEPIWTAWNGSYPLAPDTRIQVRPYFTAAGETIEMPHVLTMHPIYDSGWSRQEAFINGIWQECYFNSSKIIFGKRVTYYYGLKLDPNISDVMCWFPEMSFSIK